MDWLKKIAATTAFKYIVGGIVGGGVVGGGIWFFTRKDRAAGAALRKAATAGDATCKALMDKFSAPQQPAAAPAQKPTGT